MSALTREWQTGTPPNEQLVEVKDGRRIRKVMAFYGRDGYLPHWRTADGGERWSVNAFTEWRPLKEQRR